MKRFLIHTLLMSIPVLGFIALTFYRADGKSDPFYLRFTSPPQNSLIIGTSRAAQGIVPAEIEKTTGYENIYNYAFTVGHTSFGEAYVSSIFRKLDEDGRDGLFIIEVSPWSISVKSEEPNNPETFKEKDEFIGKTHFVSMNPNWEYLMESYSSSYIELWREETDRLILNEKGHLRVDIPMDSLAVADRTDDKMDYYLNHQLPRYRFSDLRLEYLEKLIAELKKRGKVVLVRVPIIEAMQDIEHRLMPDFDERMQRLSEEHGAAYLNYSTADSLYKFTDGNHLYFESAEAFSRRLGDEIRRLRQ